MIDIQKLIKQSGRLTKAERVSLSPDQFAERQHIQQARWDAIPKRKAAKARYRASPEGKAAKAQYQASPEGKAVAARYSKQYRAGPKGKAAKARDVQSHMRRQRTPKGKLVHCLRSRLRLAICNGQKSGSAVRDLGCSIDDFKVYIEAKFQPGMTWENWSHDGWHLDHSKSIKSFDLTVREQFLAACHYTNLQPLWALDNLRKGAA